MKASRPSVVSACLVLLALVQTVAMAGTNTGLSPLNLYWRHPADNKTSTLSLSKADQSAGYGLVRTEGYTLKKSQPGTIPLYQYYSKSRGDYFLAARRCKRGLSTILDRML